MGSFASKAGRIGPTAAVRRYPKRDPTTNAATAQSSVAPQRSIPPAPEDETAAGPRVHTTAEPSGTRSEAINLDASDPDFAANLRTLGVVQPAPTMSHSSTFHPSPSTSTSSTSNARPRNPLQQRPASSHRQIFPDPSKNPALLVLQNRNRLQEEIEADYSRSSSEGRRFVDVITIRQALQLRDAGMPEAQVEERLGMKKGTVRQFGPRGVFGVPDQRGDGWGGGAG